MSDILNRRRFLGASAAALAAARPISAGPAVPQGANNSIRIGVIGPGGRGTAVMKECIEYGSQYNSRVTAVCDIWKQRLAAADKLVSESYGAKTKTYTRHEELLADKDIDAVIIATPDHQHAKMLKAAVEAGKDVYCEKPMGNVLSELNAAYEAVKRTGRIVQIGTQRRSYPQYRTAADWVREGRIGDVAKVDVIWNAYSPYRWAKKAEDLSSLKESDVDWEQFLMGKPYRPFDPKIYQSFRLFREFSSAIIDQWMTHGIDVVHMLTGEKYPVTAVAEGAILKWNDYRENPDTIQVVLKYGARPKEFLATYATTLINASGHLTRVQGTKGTMLVENEWNISGDGSNNPGTLKDKVEIPEKPGTLHHMANWLDCVRRRAPQDLYASVEAGYGHSVACIMSADALWSGRRMRFDPERREIAAG
ncbi:MAG TPA: Gfo/Idh/MocA family oxidoreductase [Bryobacterales bacterium]|nr:Gfo/Idh/MocA family oxidoreductase [Bryobacterales bacterium]